MRKVQRHVTGLLFRLLIGYTHRSELGRVSHSSERAHRNGTVYSGVCEIQFPVFCMCSELEFSCVTVM